MLLLVLLSAGNAYEPEWRIIKNCEAKILNTGDIVLIYSINGKDITSKQQAVTNEFFIIDTCPDLFYIDSNNIHWKEGLKKIKGYKNDKLIAETWNSGSRYSTVVEDSYGRIWFVYNWGVRYYSQGNWHTKELMYTDKPEMLFLKLSHDAKTIYAWNRRYASFWVIFGKEPEFLKIDSSRGLPYKFVREIIPFSSDKVLVFPGPIIMSPDIWNKKQNDPLKEIPDYISSGRIGNYLLSHSTYISSQDSKIYIAAQKAFEIRSKQYLSKKNKIDFMFKLNDNGSLERVNRKLEEFEPQFVDQLGRGWKWRDFIQYFKDDKVYTLFDREKIIPEIGSSFYGVDKKGRAIFSLTSRLHDLVIHTPYGKPAQDSHYQWKDISIEKWMVQYKSGLKAQIKEYISKEEWNYVFRIYNESYKTVNYKIGSRNRFWDLLSDAKSHKKDAIYRARICEILKLNNLAVKYYKKSIASTTDSRDRYDRKTDMTKFVFKAGFDAARNKQYESSIRYFRLAEKYERAYSKEKTSTKKIQLILMLLKAPENIDNRIIFASEFWIWKSSSYYNYSNAVSYRDAVSSLKEILNEFSNIEAEDKKKIFGLMCKYSKKYDLSESEKWENVMIREFPDDQDFVSSIYFEKARRAYKDKLHDKAFELYKYISEKYPGSRYWGMAQFNVGYMLKYEKKYNEAVTELSKLLNSNVNDKDLGSHIMETYRNYRPKALWEIGECYIEIKDYKKALKAYEDIRDKYPFQTWCGTEFRENKIRLKKRLKHIKSLINGNAQQTDFK